MAFIKDKIKLPTIDDWPAPEVPDGVYTYGIIPQKEDYDKYCKALGVEKLPIVVNVYTFDKDCSALKDGDVRDLSVYIKEFNKQNLVDFTRSSLAQPAVGALSGRVPVLGICIDETKYNGEVDARDPRYAFVKGITAAIANFNRDCMKAGIDTDYKSVMTGYSAGATTAQHFSMARPDMVKMLLTGGGTSIIPLKSNECGEIYGTKNMYVEQKELWSKISKIYARGSHEYDVLVDPDGTLSKTPDGYMPIFNINEGADKPHVMHDMADRGPGRPVTGSDEGLERYNIFLGGFYMQEHPGNNPNDVNDPSLRDMFVVDYNRKKGDNISLVILPGCYHNATEAIKVGGLKGDDIYKFDAGARALPELLGKAYEEYAVKGRSLNPVQEEKTETKESVKRDLGEKFDQITGLWALDESEQGYTDTDDFDI